MEPLFNWIREVLFLLLPGIIYYFNLFFFTLSITNQNFSTVAEQFENYQAFTVVLVILISFILGFTVNLVLQGFIWFLRPDLKKRFKQTINSNNLLGKKFHWYYQNLIMIRHFIVGFFFMGPILNWYFFKRNQGILGIWLSMICLIFVAFLTLAYLQARKKIQIIDEVDEESIKQS